MHIRTACHEHLECIKQERPCVDADDMLLYARIEIDTGMWESVMCGNSDNIPSFSKNILYFYNR